MATSVVKPCPGWQYESQGVVPNTQKVMLYYLCLFLGTLIKGVRAVKQQSVCYVFPTTTIKSA